jgi:hypothetical protein
MFRRLAKRCSNPRVASYCCTKLELPRALYFNVLKEREAPSLPGRSFVTYPAEFAKTRSQFGGKVRFVPFRWSVT